jgi:hypothetical protein
MVQPAKEIKDAALVASSRRGRRTDSPGLKKFEDLASQQIRLARANDGLSLKELSRRLSKLGIDMDNKNLSQKLKKGTFSASLYLAMLEALNTNKGVKE